MTDEEILKVGWSPVGEVPYLRFMHVRVYDSWLHLEDCRAPLGHQPSTGGRPAEMAVAERMGHYMHEHYWSRASNEEGRPGLIEQAVKEALWADYDEDGESACGPPRSLAACY